MGELDLVRFDGDYEKIDVTNIQADEWSAEENAALRRSLAEAGLPVYESVEDLFEPAEAAQICRDIENDKAMLTCFAWISLATH